MDSEQILFIVIALILAAFSLYGKSKQQKKQSLPHEENSYHDFLPEEEPIPTSYSVSSPEQHDIINLPQNFDIYTKKNIKKQKTSNIEITNFQSRKPSKKLQKIDLENDIMLLDDFEGTELQKAFLFSEIFKSIKN